MDSLYDDVDKEVMIASHYSRNKSRLLELIGFIKSSEFTRVGVANCLSMQVFADKLVQILKDNGLEVFSINCKQSGLNGCEICEEMKGPCCDPISQAVYLNDKKTELNINVGLCLGHGLLFQKHSVAPVTTFVVKDPLNKHNVIENLK
ncbi:MAG: DUF1847 domain-containing protein [Alphaproteobacteria bacterium]